MSSTVEWVETTAKDIEAAKELALDQLGVDEADAEFEILDEPRPGLFGRLRGEARVRARIAPRAPRPKQERRRRGKSGSRDGGGSDQAAAGTATATVTDDERPAPAEGGRSGQGGRGGNGGRSRNDGNRRRSDDRDGPRKDAGPKKEREQMHIDEQTSAVGDFLDGLGTAFGLETTVDVTEEDGIIHAHVDGSEVGLLIGPRLGTLDAIQEITRNVLQRQADGREHGKVVLDVSNVREMRKQALAAFVTDAATKVAESGDEVVFEVMSSADRKVVHDTVAELDGVESTSVGEDPRRRVVIRKG